LNQGLWNGGVDIVMAHVVADAIGTPSQSQFGEVARAQNNPVVKVRQTEEMRSTLSRLNILERDVIDGFTAVERMSDVLQHLQTGGANVDLTGRGTNRTHQGVGI